MENYQGTTGINVSKVGGEICITAIFSKRSVTLTAGDQGAPVPSADVVKRYFCSIMAEIYSQEADGGLNVVMKDLMECVGMIRTLEAGGFVSQRTGVVNWNQNVKVALEFNKIFASGRSGTFRQNPPEDFTDLVNIDEGQKIVYLMIIFENLIMSEIEQTRKEYESGPIGNSRDLSKNSLRVWSEMVAERYLTTVGEGRICMQLKDYRKILITMSPSVWVHVQFVVDWLKNEEHMPEDLKLLLGVAYGRRADTSRGAIGEIIARARADNIVFSLEQNILGNIAHFPLSADVYLLLYSTIIEGLPTTQHHVSVNPALTYRPRIGKGCSKGE